MYIADMKNTLSYISQTENFMGTYFIMSTIYISSSYSVRKYTLLNTNFAYPRADPVSVQTLTGTQKPLQIAFLFCTTTARKINSRF
jgi:S-adenosylmethionine:tRNA-ribosyltransferase-isomerase (queuine synthetase)